MQIANFHSISVVERENAVPNLSVFLEELDFTVLRCFPENEEQYSREMQESNLIPICCIPFKAEADVESVLEQAWQYPGVLLRQMMGGETAAESWDELLTGLANDNRLEKAALSKAAEAASPDAGERQKLIERIASKAWNSLVRNFRLMRTKKRRKT